MKQTKVKQFCQNCKFWQLGDPAPKNIGNVGLCIWMTPRGSGFYDRTEHAPFWCSKLTFSTNSWEGEKCPVYEQATLSQRIMNSE